VDYLARRGRLVPDTRRDWASTRLVLIAPRSQPFRWDARQPLAAAFEGRLAMGNPQHTPVGIYAKQALSRLGWWQGVEARVVPAADTRAALAFVERGACSAGVVYEVDARRSERVTIVARLPPEKHDPITYQLALIRGPRAGRATGSATGSAAGRATGRATGSAAARRLHRFLLGERARAILEGHGFVRGGQR
jgi:molybdate transport system substrate-binding protein